MQYQIADKFSNADRTTKLYIAKETLFSALLAFPIPKNAPYLQQFDNTMFDIYAVSYE